MMKIEMGYGKLALSWSHCALSEAELITLTITKSNRDSETMHSTVMCVNKMRNFGGANGAKNLIRIVNIWVLLLTPRTHALLILIINNVAGVSTDHL